MATSASYRIRPAGRGDVESLLLFWRRAAENASRPDDAADAVVRLLERDPEALSIAESEGEIVGSLISGWDGWRFHLYRLAVHPDWRGRGIGRALLAEAECRCAVVGGRRVDALVLGSNESGAAFWDAVGYRPQPEWQRWVRHIEG